MCSAMYGVRYMDKREILQAFTSYKCHAVIDYLICLGRTKSYASVTACVVLHNRAPLSRRMSAQSTRPWCIHSSITVLLQRTLSLKLPLFIPPARRSQL